MVAGLDGKEVLAIGWISVPTSLDKHRAVEERFRK